MSSKTIKSYTKIKVNNEEWFYRVYGYRAGKGLEIRNKIDDNGARIIKQLFSWWVFSPRKEARKIIKLVSKSNEQN